MISKLLKLTESFGITKKEIENLINKNPNRSFNDHRWGIYQSLILKEKSLTNNPNKLHILYFRCARILEEENRNAETLWKQTEIYLRKARKEEYDLLPENEFEELIKEEIKSLKN